MSSEEIEPDAWQRKDDAYYTYPPTRHAAVDTDYDKISRFKPLFSRETIKQLWIDDYKKCILGEADVLRERGEADVAAQLEHLANRFEEVFSSDEQ